MSELSKTATVSGPVTGKGSRLGAMFLGLVPLAGLLAACGGGGGSGGGEGDMIVVKVTPTNGQETLPDLSDPELGRKLTVKFSEAPLASTMIDETNAFNSLTPNVQILNRAFARVRGTPNSRKEIERTRAFTFLPEGEILTPDQYTLTVSKFVGTRSGRLLNAGLEDFSASWTVGPDIYNPVIRNTSPAANQQETPLYTPIVITFNESLDPASAVLGQTVFIQDGGTNPPTQLNGTLLLKRGGFDLVFVPDPCVGMPPSTTIVVRMLGAQNTSFIRDKVGNALVGDPLNANEVQFQFNTKGVKPLPIPGNVPGSWSPRYNGLWNTVAYAVTNRASYAFDSGNVQRTFLATGVMNPGLTVQVKEGSTATTRWDAPNNRFVAVGPFGGDWEAKLGQPGEAVIDWRFNGVTGHTYIYQIDEADESVAIINTGNGKVEGHFRGVGTPKGIAISGPGATGSSPVVYVSNYGQETVTGIPIGSIQPGLSICTAVKELEDDTKYRVFLKAGRNPSGVALEYNGFPVGAVVNQGDNELQIFDPTTLGNINVGVINVSQRFQVGENPIDVAFSPYLPFQGWIFAYVVNQGGTTNPRGSVSLWWNSTSLIGLFDNKSGSIIATMADDINVPGRPTSDPFTTNCWIPNTAGDNVIRADITVVGGGLGVAISLKKGIDREVGPNPTRMTWCGPPFFSELAFASLAGAGQVAVWQRGSIIGPPVLYPLPGVRSMFSAYDQ